MGDVKDVKLFFFGGGSGNPPPEFQKNINIFNIFNMRREMLKCWGLYL